MLFDEFFNWLHIFVFFSQADQKKEEGNQLYKTRNYREALQKYSEAIELCPQTAAFYGNRSACHMMLSQFTQALADAKNAVQLDAEFVKGTTQIIPLVWGLNKA